MDASMLQLYFWRLSIFCHARNNHSQYVVRQGRTPTHVAASVSVYYLVSKSTSELEILDGIRAILAKGQDTRVD
jgi:hypothetical protein